MLELLITKRTDIRLLERMSTHYSQPKGFVGRNICYAIMYNGLYYGHIVAGSAVRFLPNRNEFLGITIRELNNVVNNIFYNISPVGKKYPFRNFTTFVLSAFVERVIVDWERRYGDKVLGLESLVEKPRTGELYKRAGWVEVGVTKGFTAKRVSDKDIKWYQKTDDWSGRRIWNTDPESLRPKLVFCYKV